MYKVFLWLFAMVSFSCHWPDPDCGVKSWNSVHERPSEFLLTHKKCNSELVAVHESHDKDRQHL